jgi:hypothetical protein
VTAIIAADEVRDLNLEPGESALALIKSTSVMVGRAIAWLVQPRFESLATNRPPGGYPKTGVVWVGDHTPGTLEHVVFLSDLWVVS